MKLFASLFLMLVTTNLYASTGGNIGLADDRSYGSLKMPEYSAICRFAGPVGSCTCGFIDNHLVITNSHCVPDCGNCSVTFWNGDKYVTTPVDVVMANPKFSYLDGDDWAFVFAHEGNPNVKNIAPTTTTGTVSRGGYGGLRVIADDELPIIRKIFEDNSGRRKCKQNFPNDNEKYQNCWWNFINAEVKKAGLKPLLGDSKNLKIQKCNVNGVLSIGGRTYPNMVNTSCDSAGGDSGAPLFRGGTIVGLNNSGPHTLFSDNEKYGGNAVKNENFYRYLESARSIVAQKLGAATTVTPPSNPTINEPGKQEPITDPEEMKRLYEQYLTDFQCD